MPTYDEITDRTADLLCLQDVKRWGVIKTTRDQSVATHSYNVAILSLELLERLNLATDPAVVAKVLTWALMHDGPEVLTGDIDGKFKRDYPAVREVVCESEVKSFPWYAKLAEAIDPGTNTIVKLSDKIEAIDFVAKFGIGARADDVKRELLFILWNEQVPKAARVLGAVEEDLISIVDHVLNQSTSENNGVQCRRHRRD